MFCGFFFVRVRLELLFFRFDHSVRHLSCHHVIIFNVVCCLNQWWLTALLVSDMNELDWSELITSASLYIRVDQLVATWHRFSLLTDRSIQRLRMCLHLGWTCASELCVREVCFVYCYTCNHWDSPLEIFQLTPSIAWDKSNSKKQKRIRTRSDIKTLFKCVLKWK